LAGLGVGSVKRFKFVLNGVVWACTTVMKDMLAAVRTVAGFDDEDRKPAIMAGAPIPSWNALILVPLLFGVFVRSVNRFTPLYMAVIDPFRKWIVYPSLLRNVCARWNHEFGTT